MSIKKIPFVTSILERLKSELSTALTYHSYEHTVDVMNEVHLFGSTDQLSERDLELLTIAAAFHDAGFLLNHKENEEEGAGMAVAAMEEAGGYTTAEMESVRTMILDTKMQYTENGIKQIPTTFLSRYLLDADVSNLGRDDFFEKGMLVLNELKLEYNKKFLKYSLELLLAHEWYSDGAKKLRQEQKDHNISRLKELIDS